MSRRLLAWTLHLAASVIFCFLGMGPRRYAAYNWLMVTSIKVQGEGPGPWMSLEDFKRDLGLTP